MNIKNESDEVISLKKHQVIAQARTCLVADKDAINKPSKIRNIYGIDEETAKEKLESINRVYDPDSQDVTKYIMPNVLPDTKDYTNDIELDPDNQLSEQERETFRLISKEFGDVITPHPARYNGSFGMVDTAIDFASTPPVSNKVVVPANTDELKEVLVKKMDDLLAEGVLALPEDIGVSPKFILPSFLVPKKEKGAWRLVTNVQPLNTFIRKKETYQPSIPEVKRQLAQYKYYVLMDISACYFQIGISRHDSQYACTTHPILGTVCYTTKIMGLRNSGEVTYKILDRVLEDLKREKRVLQQADAVIVVANDIPSLMNNYRETLLKARQAGLTFKPKDIIVAPLNMVLFGWLLSPTGWFPSAHKMSSLVSANPPSTVKGLRGWTGAFKQLSTCIENYAEVLKPLEQITAGKESAMKITWTEDLIKSFETAKKSIKHAKAVISPRRSDETHSYSDISEDGNCVGGRLEVRRTDETGKQVKLHAGFFSCKLSDFQVRWLTCEKEALGCKLTVHFFKPEIRQTDGLHIHHTDSLPCVMAWKRSQKGMFSTSQRIAYFLTELNSDNVLLVHTPGRDLHISDYMSRNPGPPCNFPKTCQICRYLHETVSIANDIPAIAYPITVEDIISGQAAMPFLQRAAWKTAQHNDPACSILMKLIQLGQQPEPKKTKGPYTAVKLMYGLYRQNRLKISEAGLILVTASKPDGSQKQVIYVPISLFPGLVVALHLRLIHPVETQLKKLISGHFYLPGMDRMIHEAVESCGHCSRLKPLPKALFEHQSSSPDILCSNFSADVVRKNKQKY